jgi:hypothetical protein
VGHISNQESTPSATAPPCMGAHEQEGGSCLEDAALRAVQVQAAVQVQVQAVAVQVQALRAQVQAVPTCTGPT